jgi:hypothetical protein
MRYIVSLVTLLAMVASARVVHAQGSLTVDVRGVPGTNQTTWTFSGSYAVSDVSQVANNYSFFIGNADNSLNNFTHESGELTGGIGVIEIFNFHSFPFLSSTAQVSGSQSGVHLLDGIALDSDDPITGDDFVWYAGGTFQDGETLTFSGTATIGLDMDAVIALDINLFLAEGILSRSISSVGATSTNPADFTMTFTAEVTDDPSAQLEAIEDAIDVLEAGGTISSGLANSLSAKLGAAMQQVDHQPHAAAKMVMAFIHQVTALIRTGRLSIADGTNLVTAAQDLIADLAT